MHHHLVADMECAASAVAVLAADGRAVLLAGIRSSPCNDGAASNGDISTLGILTATDTGTPVGAVGKDITAGDGQLAAVDVAI